jgi:hypothetical protein
MMGPAAALGFRASLVRQTPPAFVGQANEVAR